MLRHSHARPAASRSASRWPVACASHARASAIVRQPIAQQLELNVGLPSSESTLVKVTVAPAGGIGISRYGDISVTHEDLLALVRIEVAAGRHRA
ncbi:putative aspartic protease-like [Dorcoceras hygrometricum]|uniref:Putative aspartic protease-like n=1 Tax=Dorcoceras hygrometricum TaxID=472368 RepID=A0A2Z7AGS3_9LAMI|nr:putative aspartic protease-like [Dorcoceras hygrometricum]